MTNFNGVKFLIASTLFLVMGCSSITMLRTEELRKVDTDVKTVQTQVADLQKAVDELNLAQGGTSSKMKAELTLMLKELASQITRLQAQIDETQYKLTNLSVKIEKLDQKKVIMGVASGNSSGTGGIPGQPAIGSTPPSTAQPGNTAVTSNEARIVDGLDLENLFNQARDDYIRGKYDLALQGFKNVYEKDAGGTFRELAMFWLGETMLKQDRPDKALEAYQRVAKEFPRGNKVCSAYFKAGLIYHQKKDKSKRDEEWSKLISECPGSNEAQRAQELQKE